jgi:hypothetical protein
MHGQQKSMTGHQNDPAPGGRPRIRLLIADVDGTLVTQDKVLTLRAIQAVHNLHDAGIAFTITSGRPPRGMTMLNRESRRLQQQPTEDRYLMTRAELLDRLDVLLGAELAEEIIFADVSTGPDDDLHRASDLVRQMVTQYGMSDELGLGTFERPRQALFLGCPSASERACSEDTARMIDLEIRRLLEAAHQRVRNDAGGEAHRARGAGEAARREGGRGSERAHRTIGHAEGVNDSSSHYGGWEGAR